MATNKLMEAAADILTQSKNSAPSEPMHKMSTQVVDVGGPTPENYKPDDDSAKLDTTKAVDNSAASKNAASIKMKASAASAKMEETESEEEVIAEKSHDMEEKKEMMKKKMKEDVDALFADDSTISEEFKEKVSTIFEARVQDRVSQIEEEIETKYTSMLEEAIDDIKTDLTNKVDDYLNYVVEQWLTDNEIAIESGLRAELTEEFIAGLRNLFAEHYIDVPSEKVDLVDELAGKVEELESKLNEEIERGISYAKALVESRKNEISREVCEGLTTTQAEKIKSLAEGVEFSTEEEYKEKLETIRENYFPSGIKKADEQQLHEKVEDAGEQKVINDPFVAAVSNAISKTKF
jgi:membrane-associated HD superfamily phosphohydrolase